MFNKSTMCNNIFKKYKREQPTCFLVSDNPVCWCPTSDWIKDEKHTQSYTKLALEKTKIHVLLRKWLLISIQGCIIPPLKFWYTNMYQQWKQRLTPSACIWLAPCYYVNQTNYPCRGQSIPVVFYTNYFRDINRMAPVKLNPSLSFAWILTC